MTGDLTHVSLEGEFRDAALQLAELGAPARVFVIPGNHDRYVAIERERSWDFWAPYLRGAEKSDLAAFPTDLLVDMPDAKDDPAAGALSDPNRAPDHSDYPTLRVFGHVAVIGLCSAIPTPVFWAGGWLGARQLERLERLLERTRNLGLCRVVLVHHPITASSEPARRALRDAGALRDVLARQGAELVLHGHTHRRRLNRVAGPASKIPVIGVPSSSEVGSRPEKKAQYHVYTVHAADGVDSGFRIAGEIRGYDASTGAFARVDPPVLEELFTPPS